MKRPRYDHKTPRFREGQYIVITELHEDDSVTGLRLGHVYKILSMKPWLHCNYSEYRGELEFYRYTRDDRSNWRFAKTEEVSKFIDNKGPCAAVVINVDNYSII